MLTTDEVLTEVKRIRAMASDDESAHSAEDALHTKVLQAIADGDCADPAGLAKAALTTHEIGFARWCA